MNQLLSALAGDEAGLVLSSELVLVTSIVTLALLAGLGSLSHALLAHLAAVPAEQQRLETGGRYARLQVVPERTESPAFQQTRSF